MPRDAPTALAFVFGLVGGVLTIVVSVFLIPSFFSPYQYSFFYGPFGFFTGTVAAILVTVGATMGFVRPQHGVAWGIVMVVFGAMTIFSLGGFVLGTALSITGGALAIVAGSTRGLPGAPGALPRACTACGMLISEAYAHCPHCGHAMPALPTRGP